MAAASPTTNPVRLIGIMGATGSGKSTFTNAIIGRDVAIAGGGLGSLTSEVGQYNYTHPSGIEVSIVDTPGFNDFSAEGPKSDLKILQSIAAFLKPKDRPEQKFSGIIFLHSIDVANIDWQTQRRNITLFKKLCGAESMKNVVVVTTFWDQLPSLEHGVEKGRQLQTKAGLLKDLCDGGAKFLRSGYFVEGCHPNDEKFWTCQQIVDHLLGIEPVAIQLRKELADEKVVTNTPAGSSIIEEFQHLRRETLSSFRDVTLRLDTIKSASDESRSHQDELIVEAKRLNKKMEVYERDVAQWEGYRKEVAMKNQIELLVTREQETVAALHKELSLLRTTNEKQHNQMQDCVRELTVSLHDARKDRDAHLAQCQSLRVELGDAQRNADSERSLFRREIDCAHSKLEQSQSEQREAQASLEKQRLRNQDLQHRIQALMSLAFPWAPAPEICHQDANWNGGSLREGSEAAKVFCKQYPPNPPRLLPSAAVDYINATGHRAWGLEYPSTPRFRGSIVNPSNSFDAPDSKSHHPGSTVVRVSTAPDTKDTCILSTLPLLAGLYDIKDKQGVYYEVKIVKMGGYIAFGTACRPYPVWRMPGWNRLSAAWHLDDLNKFFEGSYGEDYVDSKLVSQIKDGDTVGCGYELANGGLFFTYNGMKLPYAFTGIYTPRRKFDVFAAIGVEGKCEFEVNFGADVFRWKEANQWAWQSEGHVGNTVGTSRN